MLAGDKMMHLSYIPNPLAGDPGKQVFIGTDLREAGKGAKPRPQFNGDATTCLKYVS
jgi:hypothetical protein